VGTGGFLIILTTVCSHNCEIML